MSKKDKPEGEQRSLFRSAPAIACAAAAFVLLLLILPGILGYPGGQSSGTVDEGPTIAAAEEANYILRERIGLLNSALDANVCVADGKLTTPSGPLPHDVLKALPGPPPSVTTPMNSAVSHIDGFSGSTADLLNAATVVVHVGNSEGYSLGSGVFIGPDVVITNAHVVEGGDPSKIVVFNDSIGVQPVELVVEGKFISGDEPDLALLRTKAGLSQPYLALSSGEAGQNVIAATFPTIYTSRNVAFQQWLNNPESAPGSITPLLDVQILNAIYPEEDGVDYIMHSAIIDKGSSGGPLIDTCGRLLGVNVGALSRGKDVKAPDEQRPLFYRAIAASSVERFANKKGVSSLVKDASPCAQ